MERHPEPAAKDPRILPGPATNSARSLTRILYVFAAISAVLWTIGLLPILHGHASPLYPYGPNFEDILVYIGRFTLFHTKAFFTSRKFSGFAYPAGCSILYAALYATSNAVTTYLWLAAATTLAALATTFAYLKRAAALSLFVPLLFLSFPFVFLVQRANVELILVLLVAFGILAYLRGLTYAAAILFGLAAACKLYPIFLLGLFLKRKQDIPAFATGLVTAILAMCAAIAYAGPDFSTAAYGFFHGVDRFQDHYAVTVRSAEVNWDHCFFSPIKYYSSKTRLPLAPLMKPYYAIAGTVALLLFLRVRTMPALNRILFLTVAMVSLPPVSYAYTLVHLYLPALLLLTYLLTSRSKPPITATLALTILFFLFLPLCGLLPLMQIPDGPIQSVALMLLMPLTVLVPWHQQGPPHLAI